MIDTLLGLGSTGLGSSDPRNGRGSGRGSSGRQSGSASAAAAVTGSPANRKMSRTNDDNMSRANDDSSISLSERRMKRRNLLYGDDDDGDKVDDDDDDDDDETGQVHAPQKQHKQHKRAHREGISQQHRKKKKHRKTKKRRILSGDDASQEDIDNSSQNLSGRGKSSQNRPNSRKNRPSRGNRLEDRDPLGLRGGEQRNRRLDHDDDLLELRGGEQERSRRRRPDIDDNDDPLEFPSGEQQLDDDDDDDNQDQFEFRGREEQRQHRRGGGGKQDADSFDQCLSGWDADMNRTLISTWQPKQDFKVAIESEWSKAQFQWLRGICQETNHLGSPGILVNGQNRWELALLNKRCITVERAASIRRKSHQSLQSRANRKKLERLKTKFREKINKRNVDCKICGKDWPPILMYEYALDNQGVLTNKRALGLTKEAFAEASSNLDMTPGRGTHHLAFLKWVEKRHRDSLEKLSKRIYCESCRGRKIERLVEKFWKARK